MGTWQRRNSAGTASHQDVPNSVSCDPNSACRNTTMAREATCFLKQRKDKRVPRHITFKNSNHIISYHIISSSYNIIKWNRVHGVGWLTIWLSTFLALPLVLLSTSPSSRVPLPRARFRWLIHFPFFFFALGDSSTAHDCSILSSQPQFAENFT